ncbi:MAG: ABC transporter permease [Nocardioidaceae bacterium]|nr:ABC transporter permease [Nocardioidaceae bacterium]NUS50215.1 ABC transporter permease [Nocardioidaceae bacterium]
MPGAAPLPRMVAAQARMETRLLLRNGEQVLLAVVIPLIVLVGGIEAARHFDLTERPAVDVLTPGVLALAVMSTSFTSLAIATGFERRYGVLKRLGSSPLPRAGLLAGKVGSLLVVEALQVLVIGTVAAFLGWQPKPSGVVGAVLCVLLGTGAFASLGLFLAGALRAEATLAVANLVYLLLLAAGAVVLPAEAYGGAADVVSLLPSGALGAGMRDALLDGGLPVVPLLVLAAWTAVGTALTARTFTWE